MAIATDNPKDLAAFIVGFCRFARLRGLPVGTQQTLAAVEAVNVVGVADLEKFSFSLRAALCSSQDEWKEFDFLFAAFWASEPNHSYPEKDQRRRRSVGKPPSSDSRLIISAEAKNASASESKGKLVSGASAQQRLKLVDFSDASPADMTALEQFALRLLRQMSRRLSRRLKIEASRERVDLRRSIRRNISRGGDPFTLAYKGRKPQQKRLVIFLDISGSMNLYSLFLLHFAYALQNHFRHVNTFLFSTNVVEVSDLLRSRKLSEVLSGVSQRALEWSGGTQIGSSLREFNRHAGRRILSRNTCFIILSDGWDAGEPALLASELRRIHNRVEKLLWLNPLLGLKDYKPITRGMSAALPHVDVFAPAHNLESLLALEHYL